MKKILTGTLVLVLLNISLVFPLNNKCGIDISFSGTEEQDYVIEQLYYDSLVDDHSIVYLKSDTRITLEHNENNIDPQGNATTEGIIRFKIDGDMLRKQTFAINEPYNTYRTHVTVKEYNSPFSLDSLEFESGVPVVGTVGDNGLEPTDGDYYWRGLLDSVGDEWHVLTYLDDDSPRGTDPGCSDGKIVLLVVNPLTPCLVLSCAESTAEFYTTPAKTYYVPHIFTQISYVTAGVEIKLFNIMNSDPIWYRYQQIERNWSDWFLYNGAILTQNIFTTDNTRYNFEYVYQPISPDSGITGVVRLRVFHYNPISPTQNEKHPVLLWRDETEKAVIKERLQREPYKTVYSRYYSSVLADAQEVSFPDGLRHGHREYWGKISGGLKCAFVAAIEGYDYDNFSMANKAKAILLDIFTIDPIAQESQYSVVDEYSSPCTERVLLGYDRINYWQAGALYDLMACYTTANGYPNGFTPIQELKVRDNLASEVKERLQFRYLESGNKGTGNEVAMHGIALSLPTYNTSYYGRWTGTQTRTYCPFPDQALTWLEAIKDSNISTPGYPNLTRRSPYYIWLSPNDGMWRELYGFGYLTNIEKFVFPLNMHYNLSGTRFTHLENHFLMYIYTRHPSTGDFVSQADGRSYNSVFLVNNKFKYAGLYRWHLETPERKKIDYQDNRRGVPFLCFYDDQIQPEIPGKKAKVFANAVVFCSNFNDSNAVWLRMQLMDDHVAYFPSWVPDIIIDGYGEYLAVRPGYGEFDGLKYNTLLVDDNTIKRAATAFKQYSLINERIPYISARVQDNAYQNKDIDFIRHVFFPDLKYFIIIDELISRDGLHNYSFILHGSSDGSTAAERFKVDDNQDIVTWVKESGVTLKAQFIAPAVDITSDVMESKITHYNEPYIKATANGDNLRFLTFLLPLASEQSSPQVIKMNTADFSGAKLIEGNDTLIVQTKFDTNSVNLTEEFSTDARISLFKKSGTEFVYGLLVEGKNFAYRGTEYFNSPVLVNVYWEKDSTGYNFLIKAIVEQDSTQLTLGNLIPGHNYLLTFYQVVVDSHYNENYLLNGTQVLTANAEGKIVYYQDLTAKYKVQVSDQGATHIGKVEPVNLLNKKLQIYPCLLYTSPSPRDLSTSRMPSSA